MKNVLFYLLHNAAKLIGFGALGERSIIKPFPRTIRGAKFFFIGSDTFIGDGAVLVAADEVNGTRYTPRCVIGDRCAFGSDLFISCSSQITIGNDVLTSARVFIGDAYHGYSDPHRPIIDQPMEKVAPVNIGDGCFLGIGSVILSGVTLGERCVVGANSVVTKSFPANTIIAGSPARAVRRFDTSTGKWMPAEPS